MYLLLLPSLLGAKHGSSTCEGVRSASTPLRAVTPPGHGAPHPPGDERNGEAALVSYPVSSHGVK